MGSVSSVAYSQKSDLDIWLCHSGSLDSSQLDELRRKAAGVENWAQSLGLEVHIFLVDSERFRLGVGTPIQRAAAACSTICCWRFYRTGVWLAGRATAWWLVPPEFEDRYLNI